jgi:glycosyltransferase involved in cell wall biosynthesis
MKISATIICKNEADHIIDCVRSLQDVDEIIVCDTGSTDDTLLLVNGLNDERIRLAYHEWGDHFAEARNAALASATGDWCIVIDADEELAPGAIAALRKAIRENPTAQTFRFKCIAKHSPSNIHEMVRAHLRCPDIYWAGRIHETLNHDSHVLANGATLIYGYSSAHTKDPDRALRLLHIDYDEQWATPSGPTGRTLYYLAREWYYRKEWAKAAELFEDRAQSIGYRAECGDALLYLARCYWQMRQGDKAREAAVRSLLLVPDCRETYEFLAEMSYPEQASVWSRVALAATNTGVLFARSPSPSQEL